MPPVRLLGLSKTYPNGHVALRGLDLEIADGELMVLVGPSGCGKTTALRLIAGLEGPTAGSIRIGERDVTGLAPQDRDVAMVFQNYALYPHMTVRENLGFALRMRGMERDKIAGRVERVAQTLGLEAVLDRRPGQLSGGQRQRVALGRAIVREPQVFLFDEPLSNLDARLRVETRTELARLHARLAATMVYVTHDQEEAMTLGGRVAVMRDGVLEQVAAPMDVYRRPATIFVAGFVGSPAVNHLPADADASGTARVKAGGIVLPLPPRAARGRSRALTLGVRPHDLLLVPQGAGDLDAHVDVVEARGSELVIHLRLGGDGAPAEIRVVAPPEPAVSAGASVGLQFDRQRLLWFDSATGRRLD